MYRPVQTQITKESMFRHKYQLLNYTITIAAWGYYLRETAPAVSLKFPPVLYQALRLFPNILTKNPA